MASSNFYIWEAGNLFLGDANPEDSNHLTLLEFQLPQLQQTMIEHMPGGGVMAMNMATTMLQAITFTFKLAGADPSRLAAFGLGSRNKQMYTLYGSIREKRSNKLVQGKALINGVISSLQPTAFSRGSGVDHDYEIGEIDRYELHVDNKEIYVIDVFEPEFRVNGNSQIAEQNRILGIPGR